MSWRRKVQERVSGLRVSAVRGGNCSLYRLIRASRPHLWSSTSSAEPGIEYWASYRHLEICHIDAIDVWPLRSVQFDVHKLVIQYSRSSLVLEGLLGEDVRPVHESWKVAKVITVHKLPVTSREARA